MRAAHRRTTAEMQTEPDPSDATSACYAPRMGKPADSVTLDHDVDEALHKLAERSGRPVDVLVNAALRDYVRYESQVDASIERGLADLGAGRTRTTDEVLAYLHDRRK